MLILSEFISVPHNVVIEKLKKTNLNPYIINWIIRFLTNRKQRVVVDEFITEFITEYANINRGVPQGTVIGPFLFSLMVEDIKPKQPETNKLIKFADDMTVSAPVRSNKDSSMEEVKHIEKWNDLEFIKDMGDAFKWGNFQTTTRTYQWDQTQEMVKTAWSNF